MKEFFPLFFLQPATRYNDNYNSLNRVWFQANRRVYSISFELNLTEILLLALSTSVDFGADAKLNYATTKAGEKFVTASVFEIS